MQHQIHILKTFYTFLNYEPSQSLVTCQVTNTKHLYLLYQKYVLKSENLLNVYLTYFQIETFNTIQLQVDNC